ncbi:hypothetical protein JVT61DRAFT_14024 [Boletus reticuloceps]|uniref:Uncharacterized protein n=1 Tax=Boletus reticuloceps TaxID=495285 RepID=A0A8I2YSI1_9AGAM|nr:hypothetical protein JVT61DRAFT_14024 [Boletus reticuloceps]
MVIHARALSWSTKHTAIALMGNSRTKFFDVCELQEMVLNLLPLPAVFSFALSSDSHKQGVAMLFRGRFCTFARRFFDDPTPFFDALICSMGVLSGSGALRILFFMETYGWEPSDMDIYVPLGKADFLTTFVTAAGYSEDLVHPQDHRGYAHGFIQTVRRFKQDNRRIDVVESTNRSPIAPILEFHITALMNYVTPLSVFSAYGEFTSHGKAIVHPMVFDQARLTLTTCMAIAKYRDRGFTILSTMQSFIKETRFSGHNGHICGHMEVCVITRRSTNDKGCVQLVFCEDLYEESGYRWLPTVNWCLGGRLCNKAIGYQIPYVMVRGDI